MGFVGRREKGFILEMIAGEGFCGLKCWLCILHGFKNRTGPAGPTGWTAGRSRFQFGPVTRPDGDQTGIGPLESAVQPVNQTNRPVQ